MRAWFSVSCRFGCMSHLCQASRSAKHEHILPVALAHTRQVSSDNRMSQSVATGCCNLLLAVAFQRVFETRLGADGVCYGCKIGFASVDLSHLRNIASTMDLELTVWPPPHLRLWKLSHPQVMVHETGLKLFTGVQPLWQGDAYWDLCPGVACLHCCLLISEECWILAGAGVPSPGEHPPLKNPRLNNRRYHIPKMQVTTHTHSTCDICLARRTGLRRNTDHEVGLDRGVEFVWVSFQQQRFHPSRTSTRWALESGEGGCAP